MLRAAWHWGVDSRDWMSRKQEEHWQSIRAQGQREGFL